MKCEDVVKLETEIDLLAFHVVLRPNSSGTFGFYYQSVCKLPVKHADTSVFSNSPNTISRLLSLLLR